MKNSTEEVTKIDREQNKKNSVSISKSIDLAVHRLK